MLCILVERHFASDTSGLYETSKVNRLYMNNLLRYAVTVQPMAEIVTVHTGGVQ